MDIVLPTVAARTFLYGFKAARPGRPRVDYLEQCVSLRGLASSGGHDVTRLACLALTHPYG